MKINKNKFSFQNFTYFLWFKKFTIVRTPNNIQTNEFEFAFYIKTLD